MSVPGRVLGMTYLVNPEDPVSAPVAYTARSVAVVAAVVVVLIAALALIVTGCWAQWGWSIGLIALGAALLAALLLVAAWPAGRRGTS